MVKKPRFRSSPEAVIEARIKLFLQMRGWLVEKMHGNAYQVGIPDLYCFNPHHELKYQQRWVDVKVQGQHQYTKAQCKKWTAWEEKQCGVWIMMDDTDFWYSKLFQPPNFRDYWQPRYDKYVADPEDLIQEILEDE